MSATVLLIEADDGDARLMTHMFGAAGYEVLRATEGRAGIELARQTGPVLIMLAVELPGLSGYKACRDIKQDPDLSDIPLIITSSTATEDIFAQHATFKTRADEYLHKPLSEDVLREAAGRFLPMDGGDVSQHDQGGEDDEDDDDVMFLDEDDAAPALDDDDEGEVFFDEPDAPAESGGDHDDLVVVGDEMFDIGGEDGLDLSGVLDNIEMGSDILEVAEDLAPLEAYDDVEVVDSVPSAHFDEDEGITALEDEADATGPTPVPAVDVPPAPVSRPSAPALPSPPASVSAPPAPPAPATLAPELEASLREQIDALTANNQALQSQVDDLSERLNNAADNLKAEFDAMRAKLDGARAELQGTRAAYFYFVSTLHTVLGEKAEELAVFGPFPEPE